MNEALTLAESGIHLALDGPGRVVDVGAHLGRFSLPLMQNPEIRVLAFEPVPWVRGDLVTRIRDELAIAPSRFRVMPQALGDQCGRTRMSIPLLGGWPVLEWASIAKDFNAIAARNPSHDLKSVEIEVEVRPLDAFGFDDLCGLKADAEGAELSVLRGARDTIARCRPFISCELEERHAEGCTWVWAISTLWRGRGSARTPVMQLRTRRPREPRLCHSRHQARHGCQWWRKCPTHGHASASKSPGVSRSWV